MVEYLYNAIRATSATDLLIAARVTDDLNNPITDGVELVIDLFNDTYLSIDGDYQDGTWYFAIPAEKFIDVKGRFSYCFKRYDEQLSFSQPFYLV